MVWCQLFCRLDFHDYLVVHKDVGKVFTNNLAVIEYSYWSLRNSSDPTLLEFYKEGILINLLKKAIPKCVVHLIKNLYDLLS